MCVCVCVCVCVYVKTGFKKLQIQSVCSCKFLDFNNDTHIILRGMKNNLIFITYLS